jgi:tetratricopeptide (TPR) repeat protein
MFEKKVNDQFQSVYKSFESNPLGTRVLIEINSPNNKQQIIASFRDKVSSLGYFPVELKLNNRSQIQKQVEEAAHSVPFGKIVFICDDIINFFHEFPTEKDAAEYLDRSVPALNIFQHAYTFWVPVYIYDLLYRYAPTFMKFAWEKVRFRMDGELPLATEYALSSKQVLKVREHKIEILENQLSETMRKNMGEYQRVNILQTLSNNYFDHGDYEKAFEAYQACVESGMSNIYNVAFYKHRMGIIYHIWGRYDKAMELYQDAKNLRENLNDKEGLASTCLQVGILYQDLGNFQEAMDCYKRSIAYENELENHINRAHVLVNIGTIYFSYGNVKAAFESIKEALEIYRKNTDQMGIALCLAHIGQLHFSNKKFDASMKYYLISRFMYDQQKNDMMLGVIDQNLENIRESVGDELFAVYREQIRKSLDVKEKDELSIRSA